MCISGQIKNLHFSEKLIKKIVVYQLENLYNACVVICTPESWRLFGIWRYLHISKQSPRAHIYMCPHQKLLNFDKTKFYYSCLIMEEELDRYVYPNLEVFLVFQKIFRILGNHMCPQKLRIFGLGDAYIYMHHRMDCKKPLGMQMSLGKNRSLGYLPKYSI